MTDVDGAKLVEARYLLQQHFPELILVDKTAATMHTGHRFSLDGDHVLNDLRNTFEEVLNKLEELADWQTNRLKPPVLILGNFQGVETGIRQLIRSQPLEATEISGIKVPTLAEMTRLKAWLVIKRNALRDYIDLAALTDKLGDELGAAFETFDRLYPQPTGAETPLRQLAKQMAEPSQFDLGDPATIGVRYKGLQAPWDDWGSIEGHLASVAVRLMKEKLNI